MKYTKWMKIYAKNMHREPVELIQTWNGTQLWYPTHEYTRWLEKRLSRSRLEQK